jgi:hypothetical protein
MEWRQVGFDVLGDIGREKAFGQHLDPAAEQSFKLGNINNWPETRKGANPHPTAMVTTSNFRGLKPTETRRRRRLRQASRPTGMRDDRDLHAASRASCGGRW